VSLFVHMLETCFLHIESESLNYTIIGLACFFGTRSMHVRCIWYMLQINYKLVLFINWLLVYKRVSQFVNRLANFDTCKMHYRPVHA